MARCTMGVGALKAILLNSLTTNFGYKVYRGFLNFGILHDF